MNSDFQPGNGNCAALRHERALDFTAITNMSATTAIESTGNNHKSNHYNTNKKNKKNKYLFENRYTECYGSDNGWGCSSLSNSSDNSEGLVMEVEQYNREEPDEVHSHRNGLTVGGGIIDDGRNSIAGGNNNSNSRSSTFSSSNSMKQDDNYLEHGNTYKEVHEVQQDKKKIGEVSGMETLADTNIKKGTKKKSSSGRRHKRNLKDAFSSADV
jgi:hypothetical protein